jgi:hypothetical protein
MSAAMSVVSSPIVTAISASPISSNVLSASWSMITAFIFLDSWFVLLVSCRKGTIFPEESGDTS